MPQSLKLVFMGTPAFAVPVLDSLVAAGHDIVCVYCQPPRPAGRGQQPRPSPVQVFAESKGLPVQTPVSLKDSGEQAAFAALGCDAAIVVAYGLLLPEPVLAAPRLGCINVHASLLPRWRGAAPIQRAIMAGDDESGITIMQMDVGLDTGPILGVRRLPIGPAMTAQDLHDALAILGPPLAAEVLAELAAGGLRAMPQPDVGVTYAAKVEPADCRLDWRRPAVELARAVRALGPRPGAWFEHNGERIKVVRAEMADAVKANGMNVGGAPPGTVLDDHLGVACVEGVLRLTRVQRPGRAAVDTDAFLRGYALPAGTVLA